MRNKIGVLDSGLGGLIILKAIKEQLPKYDYEYFGDTKNLPYGSKSQREIFKLTIDGIKYLIKQDCSLIIVACNTASAKALRKIQQQWLPKNAPTIKVLGVIVPTIETLRSKDFPAILLATESTIKSKVYKKELNKIFTNKRMINLPAPKLVPLIEKGKLAAAGKVAIDLLTPLSRRARTIILGCTHYPLIAKTIQAHFPKIKIINQANIIPKALAKYLQKHKEIKSQLSTRGITDIRFTKTTGMNQKLAKQWFK